SLNEWDEISYNNRIIILQGYSKGVNSHNFAPSD
ncbi:unnamed protein product, partial [marine sediment metagenome]